MIVPPRRVTEWIRSVLPRHACTLLLASLAAGCARDSASLATTDPEAKAPHGARALPAPEASAARIAGDLLEQAMGSMHCGDFARALSLLEQARGLDPGSTRIRDLYDEVSRIMNRRPGEWHTGTGWAARGSAESLLRARASLANSMSRVEILAARRSWADAATELDGAAGRAREISDLAAGVAEGRLCERWSDRGAEAMLRGEFGVAAVCFEVALEAMPGAAASIGPVRAASVSARLARCRTLERPQLPPAFRRRGPFRLDVPPLAERDRIAAALTAVIRVRLLLGEFDDAADDIRLLQRLVPGCAAARRLSDALPALAGWNPWDRVEGFGSRLQQEWTVVLGSTRSAILLERRGDFTAAADQFEQAECSLRWFPFFPDFESRSLDARSGALRCRRLAESASK